jgi:hypothetical protein
MQNVIGVGALMADRFSREVIMSLLKLSKITSDPIQFNAKAPRCPLHGLSVRCTLRIAVKTALADRS